MTIDSLNIDKSNILVIDDDESLLDIFANRLGIKYNIEVATSGQSALILLKSGYQPDVIVCGQQLNDMSSDDFFRNSDQFSLIPIRMIISSNFDKEEATKTLSNNKTLIYLVKPVYDFELIQAIELCLKRKKSNQEMDVLDSISNPKILIADDSKIMLKLMSGLLKSINATVFEANDGYEALQLIEKEQGFDLVILDIVMPNLDGYATCNQIRQVYSIYELPIIFLTSLSESKDIVKGFEIGANDYLQKPFKSEELLARTKTLIKLHRLSQTTVALREVVETKNHALSRLQQEIATRENIERQLIEQRERAISANQLKSEFLANMSHEIRTPLNAILGFSELLTERVSGEKEKNYLDSVISSGKSLLNLINDILDLSKIEANRVELEFAPFKIKNLIIDISRIFLYKAQSKGVELRTIIAEGFSDYNVILDELRLRQVLMNLVGNAIKFTENGFVEIELSISNQQDNNLVDIRIDISDSGVGVAQDQLQAIFEAFQQHSKQSHKAFGGTGLGLTISRKFIQMMHGTISLESEIGKGSKFSIHIPNVQISSNAPEVEIFDRNLQYEFYNPTILLVDDNEHNRKLIIEFLLNSNVRIIEAANGLEAINSFKVNLPDIVLMDLVMPIVDGFEAIGQIKKLENYKPTVPIIGLTALAFSSEKEKILNHGFNGYLSKPIQKDNLFLELSKHLHHKVIQQNLIRDIFDEQLVIEDIPKELLKELIEKLESLVSTSKVLLQSRKTGQIKNFATLLMDISQKYNSPNLRDYSEKIKTSTLSYDMEKVKKLLEDFPNVIDMLRKRL